MHLLGLFSLLDAMLGMPMPEVVGFLPLDAGLKAALCGEANNEYLPLLHLVQDLEEARWADVDAATQRLNLDFVTVREAFLEAATWAGRSGCDDGTGLTASADDLGDVVSRLPATWRATSRRMAKIRSAQHTVPPGVTSCRQPAPRSPPSDRRMRPRPREMRRQRPHAPAGQVEPLDMASRPRQVERVSPSRVASNGLHAPQVQRTRAGRLPARR